MSNISGLADTRGGLNEGNLEYHRSVANRHANLLLKCEYLKDMENVDPLNISGADEKKSEHRKEGVDVTEVIT